MINQYVKLFVAGFMIVALGLSTGCVGSDSQPPNNQVAEDDAAGEELDTNDPADVTEADASPDVSDASDATDASDAVDATRPPACEVGDLSVCAAPSNAHAVDCVEGECVFECDQSFSDDDGDLNDINSNGCERGCEVSNEVCDGVDNDCDGETDEGCQCDDGDTYDCYTGPAGTKSVGACRAGTQGCEDGVVSSCQDEEVPGTEVCDGVDNDCNGQVDEGLLTTFYADTDGDGFGDPDETIEACSVPDGYVNNADDCDDTDAAIHPDGSETCNGADDDCDGDVDEEAGEIFYADTDGDGYGDSDDTTQACSTPAGYVANSEDCDDSAAAINPDGSESCNRVDDNCDGAIDNGVGDTFYADSDGDGFGAPTNTTQACSASSGYVANSNDCNDNNPAISPDASEICNGTDDDCDGYTDENVETRFYYDSDGDGYGVSNNYQDQCVQSGLYRATQDGDCEDSDADKYPGNTEVCDGKDNDCDGPVDENVTTTFYRDADTDGYGTSSITTEACVVPGGYVTNNTDCDDSDSTVNPGAAEMCLNSTDNDCDGDVACADADCDGGGCTVNSQLGTCTNGSCDTGGCSSDSECGSNEYCQTCSGANNTCCPNNQLCLCPIQQ